MPTLELTGLLTFLGVTVVKASLMLAVAAIIALSLKAGAARARAFVWATALVGALALPVISVVAPSLDLPIPYLNFLPGLTAEPITQSPSGVEFTGKSHASGFTFAAVTPENIDADQTSVTGTSSSMNWPLALGTLWALGAIAVLSTLLMGTVRAARLRERSVPLRASQWRDLLDEVRKTTGVERPLDLRLADVASPMTWGVARPVIVLPLNATQWDDDTRRMVLVHELTHIAQNDWLFRLCGRIVCAAYWFNPLVWYASRRLIAETETACDDAVILCGSKPSRYASKLISIARGREVQRAPLGALAMARRSQLEGRIMSILEKQSTRTTTKRSRIAPVLLAVIIALVATAQPQSRPYEEKKAPKASVVPVLATPAPSPVPVPTPTYYVWAPRSRIAPSASLAYVSGVPGTIASTLTVGRSSRNFIYTMDDGTSIRVVIKGAIEFNGDATEVLGLSRKATLRISVLQGDVEREVVYKNKKGDVQCELFVDGDRVNIKGDAEDFVHDATQVAAQLVHNQERFDREVARHEITVDDLQVRQLEARDMTMELDMLVDRISALEEELDSMSDAEQRLHLRALERDVTRLHRVTEYKVRSSDGFAPQPHRSGFMGWRRNLTEEMSDKLERRLEKLSETSKKLDGDQVR